jgi:hypothetical protein
MRGKILCVDDLREEVVDGIVELLKGVLRCLAMTLMNQSVASCII